MWSTKQSRLAQQTEVSYSDDGDNESEEHSAEDSTDSDSHEFNSSNEEDEVEFQTNSKDHYEQWLVDDVLSVFLHAICLLDDVQTALSMPALDVLALGAAYVASFQ